MGNALTTKKTGGFLAKIDAQKTDGVDYAAVDKAAGFKGNKGDAPVDTRIEDNLVRALRAYAKVAYTKKRKPQTVEDLLAQAYHLRQRLIDLTKKICMYNMQAIFFKLDPDAEENQTLVKIVEAVVQPEVLRKAFEIHKREAPAHIPSVAVRFIGRKPNHDIGKSLGLFGKTEE